MQHPFFPNTPKLPTGVYDPNLDMRPELSEWRKGLGAFGDEMQAFGGGLTALGAQHLKSVTPEAAQGALDKVHDWGQETYAKNIAESTAGRQTPKVARIEDIDSPDAAMSWASYQLGKGLPMLASLAIPGAAGAHVGKAAVGQGTKAVLKSQLGRTVAGRTVTDAAKKRAKDEVRKYMTRGAVGGGAAGAFGVEGGAAYGGMLEEGISPEDAAGPATAVGLFNAGLEVLPIYKVAKSLGAGAHARRGIREAIFKDKKLGAAAVELARRATRAGAEGAVTEGITEGLQELTNIAGMRWAKDDPLFEELSDEDWSQLANAAAAGGLVGGVAAGAAGPFRGVQAPAAEDTTARRTPPGEQAEVIPPAPGDTGVGPAGAGPQAGGPPGGPVGARDPLTGEYIPGERPANIVAQPGREGVTIEGIRARKNQLTQQLAIAPPDEAVGYREELARLEQLERELELEAEKPVSTDPNDFELTPQQPIPRRETGPREQQPTAQQGELPGMETQGAFNFDPLNEQTEMDFVFGEVDQTTRGKPYASRESAEKAARALQKNGKLQTFEVVEEQTSTGSKFVIQDKGPEIKPEPADGPVPFDQASPEAQSTAVVLGRDATGEVAEITSPLSEESQDRVNLERAGQGSFEDTHFARGVANNTFKNIGSARAAARRAGLEHAAVVEQDGGYVIKAWPGEWTQPTRKPADNTTLRRTDTVMAAGRKIARQLGKKGFAPEVFEELGLSPKEGGIMGMPSQQGATLEDLSASLHEAGYDVLGPDGTPSHDAVVQRFREQLAGDRMRAYSQAMSEQEQAEVLGLVPEPEPPAFTDYEYPENAPATEARGNKAWLDLENIRGFDEAIGLVEGLRAKYEVQEGEALPFEAVLDIEEALGQNDMPDGLDFYSQPEHSVRKTVEQVREELGSWLGQETVDRLEKSGLLYIHEGDHKSRASGFWSTGLGRIQLNAAYMPDKGGALGVLLHEGSHAGLDFLLGGKLNEFVKDMARLAQRGDKIAQAAVATAGQFADQATADALAAGRITEAQQEKYKHYIFKEEAAAYYVQMAEAEGYNNGVLRRMKNSMTASWSQNPIGKLLGVEMSGGLAVGLANKALTETLSLAETLERFEQMDLESAPVQVADVALGLQDEADRLYEELPEAVRDQRIFIDHGLARRNGRWELVLGEKDVFIKPNIRKDSVRKLGDLVDSPKMFRAAPDLQKLPVEFAPLRGDVMQVIDGKIYLSNRFETASAAQLRPALLRGVKELTNRTWTGFDVAAPGPGLAGVMAQLRRQAMAGPTKANEKLRGYLDSVMKDTTLAPKAEALVRARMERDRIGRLAGDPGKNATLRRQLGLAQWVENQMREELGQDAGLLADQVLVSEWGLPPVEGKSIEAAMDEIGNYRIRELPENLNSLIPHTLPEAQTNFKKWFARSKAVDEAGRPLKVYHGRPYDWEAGEYGLPGQDLGEQRGEWWFSDSAEVATAYSDTQTFEADPEFGEAMNMAPQTMAAYLALDNPLIVDAQANTWATVPFEGKELTTNALVKIAKGRGNDGLIIRNVQEGGNTVPSSTFVAFDKRQIKSATGNRGTFASNSSDILYSNAGLWRSALLDTVGSAKQDKAAPAQWKGWLKKQPGVKKEEMEDMGLEEWLDAQEGTVSKEEVEGFVRAGGVKLEEVVKGERVLDPTLVADMKERGFTVEESPDGDRVAFYDGVDIADSRDIRGMEQRGEIPPGTAALAEALEIKWEKFPGTRHHDWRTEGGKNYKELLVTIPQKVVNTPADTQYSVRERAGESGVWELYDTATGEVRRGATFADREMADTMAAELNTVETKEEVHKGEHWSEPNVLVHIRFDERTTPDGVRTLLLDEVQSDWHQEGRDKGYGLTAEEKQELKQLIEKRNMDDEVIKEMSFGEDFLAATKMTSKDDQRLTELQFKVKNAVPDAPFKSSWPMLGVKRAIRWAVDNGFDRVAWTPGEKQAERYSLSRQVSAIRVGRPPSGNRVVSIDSLDGTEFVRVWLDKEGKIGKDALPAGYAGKHLKEVVGVEMAEKILAAEESTVFEGDDLKIGGEGMKGFYDKKLVNDVNKYLKKYKTRVQVRDVNTEKKFREDAGESATNNELPEGYKLVDDTPELPSNERHYWTLYNEAGNNVADGIEAYNEVDAALYVKRSGLLAPHLKGNKTQSVWSFDIPEKLRDDVLQGQMLYSRVGDTLTVSPERLNALLREFGYAHRPEQSKAWIAWVNPKDFLKSAVPGLRWEKGIESEAGTFDPMRMSAETQTPFVQVRDNRIVGHEGRHRLAAAANAGVKKVAVVLRDMGDNRIVDDSLTLHGQDFGSMGRGQGLVVEGAKKLSYANADMLDQEFDGDSLYSFAGEMGTGRGLTDAQRVKLRNLLKELDTAEEKLYEIRQDPNVDTTETVRAFQDTARIRSEMKHEITPLVKPSRIGPSILQIVDTLLQPKKEYGDIALAKSMAGKKDMEAIRALTGWHKAEDGKWRYEISDRDALMVGTGKKGSSQTLGSIFIHDELFAVYPELRTIEVHFTKDSPDEASFSRDLWAMTIAPGIESEIRKSILHEIQHAVQALEGFAKGGSVDRTGVQLNGMVEKRQQDNLKLMQEFERKVLKGVTVKELADKAKVTEDKKDLIVLQKAQDKIANLVMKDPKLFEVARKARTEAPGAFRMYEALFGEQEARVVEARMDMTEEERQGLPPSINYDAGKWTFPEFVITFNNKDYNYVPNPWVFPQKKPEPSPQMDLLDSLYSLPGMFEDARKKLWTHHDTLEEMNDLGAVQRAYVNYVDMFATMEAKDAAVKDVYDLAESRRGAKLDEINNRFAHPLRNLIGKSGHTLEQVNDWLAARHILLDNVNRNMAERASYQFAYDLLPNLDKGDRNALKAEMQRLKKKRDTDGAPLTDKQVWEQMYDLVDVYVERELESRDMKNQGIRRQVIKWRWKHFKEHASGMFRPELDANGNRLAGSTLENSTQQPDAYEIYHTLKDEPVMGEIAQLFDGLTQHQLALLEEGGLIPPRERSRLMEDKSHYAPLRREAFDYESAFDFFNQGGQGGKGLKARMGTEILGMKPVHIVENALARTQGAAARAQRNMANNFLYDHIMANRAEWSNWFSVNTHHKRTSIDNLGFSRRGPTPNLPVEDIIVVRGGKRILLEPIEQNQRAMAFAAAANRLDSANMGSVGKVLNFVNSIVRFTAITASVPFMLANMVRDPLTAAYNMQASEAEAYTKEIFSNYGRSFKALRKTFLQGLRDPADPDTQMVERWEKAGGRISFIESLKEMESGFRGFQRDVWLHKTPGIKQMMKMFDGIESANIAVENVMRLATFDTLMNNGVSEVRAARIAKDLTTNFSRKGFKSSAMGTLYLFFNATVQGNVQVVRNLMGSKKLQGAVAGTVAFAFLMDMMGRALGDDDEWDQIPRYEKERNIVLPFKVGGEYIKIPAPWVYNVVWRLGGMLGENAAGVRSAGDTAADTMAMTLTTFNPMGGPTMWQALAPTAVDPFIQVLENKDFAGNRMRPENFPGAGHKADAELAWSNTPEVYKDIARFANEATGGNIVESGWIDIAPSTYENFVNFLGGGLYRFGTDVVGASKGAMEGDLEAKQVPILKQFSTRPTSQMDSQLYHERAAKVLQLDQALKKYRAGPDKNMTRYQELKDKRGNELRMLSQVKDVDRQLKSLRQRLQLAERRGDRERVEELRDRMDSVRKRFNQTYNRRVGN